MLRRQLTIAGLAALTLTATASAAEPPTIVGDAGRSSSLVAAYGETTAWSRYDRTSRRWALMVRDDRGVRRAKVRSRPQPFDIDLGPGPDGEPWAVYSRCAAQDRRTGERSVFYSVLPGCDLYRYDVRRATERRLALLSTAGASETLPTIWRDRIAFSRRDDTPDNVAEYQPKVLVATLTGRARRIPGGTAGRFSRLGRGEYSGGAGPVRMDLRGDRLAFAWQYDPGDCGGAPPADEVDASELWIAGDDARIKLGAGCSTSAVSAFNDVTVGPDRVFFSFIRDGVERRYASTPLSGGGVGRSVSFPFDGTTPHFAQDGQRTVMSKGRDVLAIQGLLDADG